MRILAFILTVAFGATSAQACDGMLLDSEAFYQPPICLSGKPERIVALDPAFTLGLGLDLDLPIVGAPLAKMSNEPLMQKARNNGVVDLGFVTEPSLEAIVALQPDLLLGFVGSPEIASGVYPLLSQLGPVALDISADWRSYYLNLAHLVEKDAEAQSNLDAFDARLNDIKARVPEDVTVSIVRITSWDFQVYTDGEGAYAPFRIFADAGVKRTDYENVEVANKPKRPDWEELAELDGDILLYIVDGTNDSKTSGRYEEVINNPLWQMLPAVQAGRVHRLDVGTWMEFSGLGSAHAVLDDIERFVIGAE